MNLLLELRTEAERLGFFFLGVAPPVAPPHYSFFTSWLNHGFHAGMDYLSSPRSLQVRADPAMLFSEVGSIITLGKQYPSSLNYPSSDPLTGRIASYAWVDDYHMTIPPLLQQLAESLSGLLGHTIHYRTCTDSSPILERDYASLSGMGWIGKNTCLISPQVGSFIFLAELLVNCDLPATQEFQPDRCGSCTRCMDACPTGCILPNRIMDTSKCISYLTIENKGSIPPALRSKLGNWIFGCDICQSVCPWNSHPKNTMTLVEPPNLSLIEELQLSESDFRQKFYRSPILRSKRRGYLRNICVALGNSHSPEVIPDLAQILHQEPDPLIRSHAAWALGEINTHESRTLLTLALKTEMDELVKEELISAISTRT